MDSPERRRCRELAKSSSSVSYSLYSEIEEVGWEHLVHLAGDFKSLSFRIMDSRGRAHLLEIRLGKGHPQCQPSISADVPILFNVAWTPEMRLKDLVHQFREHLEKLHEFWSTLDEIDNSLRVVNVERPSRSQSSRKIELGDDCFILLSIDVKDPRSLPEPSCKLIETAMAKTLQTMMTSLDLRVGLVRITNVIILPAIRLSTLFVLRTGFVLSQQQDSLLMFSLVIVHTVPTRLLSKSTTQGTKILHVEAGPSVKSILSVPSHFMIYQLSLLYTVGGRPTLH